jgi:leucyl-tRNA synthetase
VLEQVVAKMSKSLKNVVNPDEVCDAYGVDTFRLYEMFMGPLADSKPWNPRDVPGARRFLDRVWRLYVDPEGQDAIRPELLDTNGEGAEPTGDALELERGFHRCLARVEDSFKQFNFNTAVAAFMEFINLGTKNSAAFTRSQAERLACALAPFAPHMAEELWERLGHSGGITRAPWPSLEVRYLEEDGFELVVQINGKVRGRAKASKESGKGALEALAEAAVAAQLDGKERLKTIVVPGRLVNFVVR